MNSNQDISIQDVTALQILPNGDSSTLAKGKLSVISTPSDSKDETALILSVGPTTSFPLTKKTLFGTFDDRPNVFAFQLPQSEGDLNVQIHLPKGIEDPLHPANADFTRLEDLLIEKGLLLTGIRAAGNEIAAGIREGAQRSTKAVSEIANERSSTINDKVSIDPDTHSIAQRAAESTATAASYTSTLATSIGSIASKGGETIGRGVRDLGEQTGLYAAGSDKDQIRAEDKSFDKKEESGIWSDTKSAASEAGGAISQGASSLGNSIAQASEKTLGSDFNRLASKTGEAAKNSGKTALNAFESTSMIYAGGNAAAGTSKGMKEDANETSKKDGEEFVKAE